jgi:hypothetical protein
MWSGSKLATSSSSSATVGERAARTTRSGSRARTAATSDASAATRNLLILSSILLSDLSDLRDKIRLLGFKTLHDSRR